MRRCCLLLVCLLLLTGCGRADTQDVSSFAPAEGDRLVIFTSHKETIYEPILKEFEQRTGIWVELETGGTVTLLERIAAGESGANTPATLRRNTISAAVYGRPFPLCRSC